MNRTLSFMTFTQMVHYCKNVALYRAESIAQASSVSLVRLRLQESQYEQFIVNAKNKIAAAERLAIENQTLCCPSDSEDTEDDYGMMLMFP